MTEAVWNGHTQGMTIRDILEKVDLFNVSVLNSNQKGTEKHLSKDTDGKTIIKLNDPSSAYLGPKLWDRQISLDLGLDLDSSADEAGRSGGSSEISCGSGDGSEYTGVSGMSPGFAGISIQGSPKERARSVSSDLQVMNMEEFLAENGLSLDIGDSLPINEVCGAPSVLDFQTTPAVQNKTTEIRDIKPTVTVTRPNVIMKFPKVERPVTVNTKRSISAVIDDTEEDCDGEIDDPVPYKKPSNDFLYAESKRARLEREKAEKKRKFELELEFAPEDLALATVPGAQFDPSTRHFDVEELRPQPIIRKRKRIYVAEEAKDDRYWNCRIKNNVAARRSREARRLKENQIALRAAYLEKENRVLKQELDDVKFDNTKLATERDILKMKLAKFEQIM